MHRGSRKISPTCRGTCKVLKKRVLPGMWFVMGTKVEKEIVGRWREQVYVS
jgi:hypothetical protein